MEEMFINNHQTDNLTSPLLIKPEIKKKETEIKEKTVFNEEQIKSISKYLIDLSKLLFGSAIVGFFIPGYSGKVTTFALILGIIFSTGLSIGGVLMLKSIKSKNI